MRTALDTNILSALWSGEPLASKIAEQLAEAHSRGGLVVSAPVYAELLAHPSATQKFVDSFLADTGIAVDFHLSEEVWRRAGAAFALYAQRRRKSAADGPKRLLVDFVVAAHALVNADRLMSLDVERYASFPRLMVV